MRSLRFLLPPLLLVMLPLAAAQGPTSTLEIHGGPTSDVVSTRGVAIVSFNVTLRISNVVCSGSSTFSVDVVGSSEQRVAEGDENATQGNATVHVTPASLSFPVSAGPYGSNPGLPAAQPYQATQSIAVAVESAGLPNETVYDVTVEATLRPASAPNCRGTASAPEATSNDNFVVRFNETDALVATSPELATPWFLVPVAAVVAVVAFRRRPA
ncbi:MAG TPA: hypothetical protein VGB18_04320 [Candidatus Thermoplasmatota archaeon]